MDKIKNNIHFWILLVLMVVIVSIVTYFRVRIQMDIGPPYDTYDFLSNAAEFAGKSIGYTDIRPPFLSLLTSFIFRFEGLSVNPIFYVDAIIDVLGAIGLYLFLKLRFNSLNSFFGGLLYATLPIVLTYTGVGYPDLPSVSISIWALYLTILAVKRNSRYFLLSFPLAMLSFLTKFNQALIIFPMFLFILINWHSIKNRKNFLMGIILSLLIVTPFLIFFTFKYGSPLSPFFNFYGTSSGNVSDLHFDYNPDLLFYVRLIPLMIGSVGQLIVLMTIGAILFLWIRLVQGKRDLPNLKDKFKDNKAFIFILLILVVVFFLSIGKVPYLLSEVIFFIISLVLFKLLKADDLDLLFLSWFGTFLIFYSVYLIKDIRYFLGLMPAISYFLVRALVWIESQVGLIKNRKLTFYLIPILVVVILISSALYLPSISKANQEDKNWNVDMASASHWLASYDPGYRSKEVYSDLWPLSGWYLQMNVGKMPEFQNNQMTYASIHDYKPSQQDSEDFNNFLLAHNVTYYFSIRQGLNLTSYKSIKQFRTVIIYEKD